MAKKLLVYDESKNSFRDLDKNNHNDDIVCGSVLFNREAICEIRKYFYICGYAIIEKETKYIYPIDIQKDKIVIFEGTYNCFPLKLKELLIDFNITELIGRVWSSFFVSWQFFCDFNAFTNYGPFIKLCNNIIGSATRMKKLLAKDDIALYEPINYEELCEFTRNIFALSGVDVNKYDYYTSVKYLIESLLNNYHINFTNNEITSHFQMISQLVDERWTE